MGMKNIMLGGWDKSIELVSVVCSSMTFLEFQLLIPTSDFKNNAGRVDGVLCLVED
jgi:hypothetical protein